MRRASEEAAAKNTTLHAKVAAVFLGHQIRGSLRSAEERMQGTVDAALLGDAVVVFRTRVLPAGFQFLERKFVGRVAVDFVGAEQNEHRFGAMEAGSLEKIDRAEGVDFEIEDGDIARLVVGRLGGAVNNQIKAIGTKEGFKTDAIAHVEFMMNEIPGDRAKTIQIPGGVTGRAKENLAHIVVDAVDFVALAIKMFNGFRTDQSTRAGNQNCF